MSETFQDFRKRFNANLFDEYAVSMQLKDIVGGVPANPDVIAGWIHATCKQWTEEERQKIVDATSKDLEEVSEEIQSKSWTRFKRDETGVFIEGRQIKAGLKEAANILKRTLKPKIKSKSGAKGTTALKSKLAETVFVNEDKIYLLREGKPITDEVPTEERPIHVMVPQGPRTALKRCDVLYDVGIGFSVRLAKTDAVTEEALFASITYLGECLGIGADRSQGRGLASRMEVEKK